MKKIAIVGAGLAGLGLAWHLLERGVSVVLFDPLGPGGGTSGASTGLLHPFPAKQALRSWRATEAMEATRELLDVSEKALGRPVAERTGVLRLAIQESMKKQFRQRADEDKEAIWWEAKEVLANIPKAVAVPGLWVPSGIAVYSKSYLQGLWEACQSRGAALEKTAVKSLSELSSYDQVVLATGHETLHFPECAHLSLEPVKGRALLCRWNGDRLPFSVASLGHITPAEDPALCQIGSTYEREPSAVKNVADELRKKAAAFYPPAREFEVVSIQEGIRLCPKDGYRPIVEQIAPKAWVFTGLGSRGLLYHALLGKELANSLA